MTYRDPSRAHLESTQPATQARGWFNDAVVHALRLRDVHPQDDVVMCLPHQETYRNLCRGVARSLGRCQVRVVLIASTTLASQPALRRTPSSDGFDGRAPRAGAQRTTV